MSIEELENKKIKLENEFKILLQENHLKPLTLNQLDKVTDEGSKNISDWIDTSILLDLLKENDIRNKFR